jgi:hypothetical protein
MKDHGISKLGSDKLLVDKDFFMGAGIRDHPLTYQNLINEITVAPIFDWRLAPPTDATTPV